MANLQNILNNYIANINQQQQPLTEGIVDGTRAFLASARRGMGGGSGEADRMITGFGMNAQNPLARDAAEAAYRGMQNDLRNAAIAKQAIVDTAAAGVGAGAGTGVGMAINYYIDQNGQPTDDPNAAVAVVPADQVAQEGYYNYPNYFHPMFESAVASSLAAGGGALYLRKKLSQNK